MKIYPSAIQTTPEVQLCAGVECDSAALPDSLWFSLREPRQAEYSSLMDPFVIALLPLAMKLGEPLNVEGLVSERLAYGLREYQRIIHCWFPQVYQRVAVQFSGFAPTSQGPAADSVGCCFSAGVDAYYSIEEMVRDGQEFPAYQLTHALMINGFDQINDQRGGAISGQFLAASEPYFKRRNLKLMMLDTNLKAFRDAVLAPGELFSSYISALAACVHSLAPGFARFATSAHGTYDYADLEPSGNHPALDHWLATDQLQFMHVGANADRAEKIEAIARDADVQKSLRVCSEPLGFLADGTPANCCVCEKCMRTIVALDIVGELPSFPGFQAGPPIAHYRNPAILGLSDKHYIGDNLRLAQRYQRNDWILPLKAAFDQHAN